MITVFDCYKTDGYIRHTPILAGQIKKKNQRIILLILNVMKLV